MKKVIAMILSLVMILSLAACGTKEDKAETPPAGDEMVETPGTENEEAPGTEAPAEDGKITIGFVAGGLTNPSAKMITEAMQAHVDANYPNVELIILDGQNSVETGINCIESLIVQGVDAIGFSPQDNTAYNPTLADAVASGIPILTCETDIDCEDMFEYYACGPDILSQGYVIGEYYAANLPENAKIGHITGNWGNSAQILRDQGFMQALSDAGRDDVEVIAYDSANWDRNQAMALAEDWLITYPEMCAIYAIDGSMGLGALQACVAAGRNDILISGCDLLDEAAQEIMNEDNGFAVDAYRDIAGEAESYVDMMVLMAKGEEPEYTEITDDGFCKYNKMIPITVTIDNVKEFYNG